MTTCAAACRDEDGAAPVAVALTAGPGDVATPIACTLAPDSLGGRLDDWQDVLSNATTRVAIPGGVRVVLDDDTPMDELVRLAAAEHDCCLFFRFAITIDVRGVALEVTAPDDALSIVQSLFGAPS